MDFSTEGSVIMDYGVLWIMYFVHKQQFKVKTS